jgi:surface protein
MATLKSGAGWYAGSADKASITAVHFVAGRNEVPTGWTESWNADAEDAGAIKGYLNGTVVYVAGDGSGSIVCPSDMTSAFAYFTALATINGLSLLDTSGVTSMLQMFGQCSALKTIDLRSFNTGAVTNTAQMFSGCPVAELDLTSFDTSLVTNMAQMFAFCGSLTKIFVSDRWSTTACTQSLYMFYGDTGLVGGNGTAYNAAYIGVEYARIDTLETPGYFTYKKYYPLEVRGDHIIQGETLYDIAEAIRSKTGSTDSLTPSQMAAAILGIGTS